MNINNVAVAKKRRVAHSDLLYRLCVCRDMRNCAAGEVAAHYIESGQSWEGEGDEEGEKECREEKENAREKEGAGWHNCGVWRVEVDIMARAWCVDL